MSNSNTQALKSPEEQTQDNQSVPTPNVTCSECDGQAQHEDTEIVCQDCGLVLKEDSIDHGPEWRDLGNTTSSRVGPPRTEQHHDHGLGGEIGHDDLDTPKKRAQISRFRRQESWSMSKFERNKMNILIEIKRILTKFEAGNSTIDRACRIGRTAHDADLALGHSLEALATAAALAAIREQGFPIQFADIEEHASATERSVYQLLQKIYNETSATRTIIDPIEYIPRLTSEFDVPAEIETRARDLVLQAQEHELHIGKNPISVAAGALYAASEESMYSLTQKEISEEANVCPRTIRTNARDLTTPEIKTAEAKNHQ